MKGNKIRMNRYVQFIAFIALTAVVGQCLGNNPIFRDVFTADPVAMVFGDTVYVYVGHGNAKVGQFFTMPD
jgi:hypothetical protein